MTTVAVPTAAAPQSPPTDIPLSLYLHLPWCARKCPYCDFNSHAVRGPIPEAAYVDALIRDLDFELQDTEIRPVGSVFFGGGTPSLFSASAIGRLIDQVACRLQFASDVEITLEANPGTAEAENFRGYRAAGVNRLSIGVQSFDDAQLKTLGRIHGRAEALRAVDMARAADFDNLNLDLMFALPGQAQDQALADLETAISLHPEHLSWYHLTIEPNTEFAARPPSLPDVDTAAALHDAGCERLARAGFKQYETSAFAQAGRACRHNLNYWQFGDYLGIGAGAHAKRSSLTAAGMRIERRARHKHPRTFMEQAGSARAIQDTRVLRAEELPFEFCMNALRLHEGVPQAMFEQRTGRTLNELQQPLSEAARMGLMSPDRERLKPSEAGRRHQNRLLELFL